MNAETQKPPKRRLCFRRGHVALEEVMLLTMMFPLVVGAFAMARFICVYVYEIINTLVRWPFL